MIESDDEILKTWRRDPDAGFRLLYRRYAGSLLRYVYRFTGNQEQAEEILHDVFAQILKEDFSSTDFQFKSWLFTVAKNKSLNFERRKKHEVLSQSSLDAAVDPRCTEQDLGDAQVIVHFEAVQQNLPADLAKTWNLRKQGLDYQEIATKLDIPLGTVKSRFNRLVSYFKKELKVEKSN